MTVPSDADIQRAFDVLSRSTMRGRTRRSVKRALSRTDPAKEHIITVSLKLPKIHWTYPDGDANSLRNIPRGGWTPSHLPAATIALHQKLCGPESSYTQTFSGPTPCAVQITSPLISIFVSWSSTPMDQSQIRLSTTYSAIPPAHASPTPMIATFVSTSGTMRSIIFLVHRPVNPTPSPTSSNLRIAPLSMGQFSLC